MEKTKTPKQIIQSYLEERAKNDPLFANVYAKPNKNINECFDYILSEAKTMRFSVLQYTTMMKTTSRLVSRPIIKHPLLRHLKVMWVPHLKKKPVARKKRIAGVRERKTSHLLCNSHYLKDYEAKNEITI